MSTNTRINFSHDEYYSSILKKVEDVWKFQENQEWYFIWKTMWLGAWMCMVVSYTINIV